MRVLVIGGTGHVGAAIVKRLVAVGHLVSVFHRGVTTPKFPDGIDHIFGERSHLPDFSERFRSFAPEIVVDAIAATREHAQTLVSTFRAIARRVIVLSSGDVYFANDVLHRKEAGPIHPTPLSESALLRKQRYPYRGLSMPASAWTDIENYEKMDVEEVAVSQPDLPATILRLPMVYGPGAYDAANRRFFTYLKRIDDGRRIILLNQALAQWHAPWGYTENVAEAVALSVENEGALGQIYNVCEQGRPTIADWVRDLAAVTNWSGRVLTTSLSCPPPDPSPQLNLAQNLDMDSTRIRVDLGYREPVERLAALHRTVAWERENPVSQIDPTQFDYAAEDAFIAQNHLR